MSDHPSSWRLIAKSWWYCGHVLRADDLGAEFGQTTNCDHKMWWWWWGLFGSEHLKVQKWNSEKAKSCTKILNVCSSSLWPTAEICQFSQFWCMKETAKDKLKVVWPNEGADLLVQALRCHYYFCWKANFFLSKWICLLAKHRQQLMAV